MITILICILIGLGIEMKLSPRVKFGDDGVYLHYSQARGVRMKKKLF